MNASSSSLKTNIGVWLQKATDTLELAGIPSARLDALILLEDITQTNRAHLLAHPELVLRGASLKKLEKQVARRVKHEPLAYIRGRVEFYGREFLVDKSVLVPRPETETMIELLKQIAIGKMTIADIGTGSGCLAVTAKLELPKSGVFAIDVDPNCLKIARRNALKLGARVDFLHGSLLEPLLTENCQILAILANLPYVPDRYKINQAALEEPKIAIFGGKDGLDVYRAFWLQIKNGQKPGFILTEALPPQHQDMANLAKASGYRLLKVDSLIQLFKKI